MDQIKNFYETILKSSHPLILSLHLLGKTAPILSYLLGSWFIHSFAALFILVILLLAADFYLTKNISGRKLVQLRWWYDSMGQAKTPFTFESYKQYPAGNPINPIDSKLFWWSIYLTPVVWAIFGILCILKFQFLYLLLVILALGLNGWNAHGFRSCDKWEPGQDSGNNSWIQLPNLSSLENLSRIARFQSFFQSN